MKIITPKRLGRKVSDSEGSTEVITSYPPLDVVFHNCILITKWLIFLKGCVLGKCVYFSAFPQTRRSKLIGGPFLLRKCGEACMPVALLKSLVVGKPNYHQCENDCLCPRQLLRKQSCMHLEMAHLYHLRTTVCYITLIGQLFQVP